MNAILGAIEKAEFVSTLKKISSKPSMYLSAPTYWGFCSFVEGFDLACGGAVLRAFSVWREGACLPENLGWSAAFFETLYPSSEVEPSTEEHKQAMQALAKLFETILLN
jgi:hypothetical protein